MTLVMFGAILVDRPALSIRNLAIAALIVLAREPEALLGPELPDVLRRRRGADRLAPLMHAARTRRSRAPCGCAAARAWIAQPSSASLGTTFVASIATAPFAAYHFQSLNPLGLIGNALALPLVSLVVMPSAVLGVLAYPFGLDRPVWQMMGLAVAQVLAVSAWVSGLTGSTVAASRRWARGALALLALGPPRR